MVVLVPAELDQQFDREAVSRRAEALQARLGYSLQPLINAVRMAS